MHARRGMKKETIGNESYFWAAAFTEAVEA